MCPEYEKLKEAYLDATREFQRSLWASPPRVNAAKEIDAAVEFRNLVREHALAHTKRCLRCENDKPARLT